MNNMTFFKEIKQENETGPVNSLEDKTDLEDCQDVGNETEA